MAAKLVLEESWRFVRLNPDIVYKGAPVVVVAYFFSPIIITAWEWLPWIWVSYDIARRVPSEWVSGSYESVKDYLTTERSKQEDK